MSVCHIVLAMLEKYLLYCRLILPRMEATTSLLSQPRVEVGDRPGLETKLAALGAGGPGKLQLIVDFDYTISRAHREGKPVDCSWGVLENFPDLPSSYMERVQVLRSKYYPIEIDPGLSIEEKVPHMAKVRERKWSLRVCLTY